MSQRTRIQNELVRQAQQGTFYRTSYDPQTKLAVVDEGQPVVPAEALSNETESSFGTPRRHRISDRLERLSWQFELRVRFNQEVTLEHFERSLIEDPPVLAKDADCGYLQVRLILRETRPTHPYQQESSAGTQAIFIFDALQSPV